jgi:hypothetical protein
VDGAQGDGFIAEKDLICHIALPFFLRRFSTEMKNSLTDRGMG